MRLLCVLLCLFMIALVYLSPPQSSRPLSFVSTTATPRQSLGRKLMNAPSLSSEYLNAAPGNLKKEGDGRMGRTWEMGDSAGEVDEFSGGAIYNVDYHGVTTHPSPLPKHPKP